MNILVTGVSGFVGSYLANILLKNGNAVTGVSRSNNSNAIKTLLNDKNFKFIKADLSKNFYGPDDIDVIVHAAAEAKPSGASVLEYVDNNVIGVKNISVYATRVNVKKIIYFSSLSVYGEIDRSIVDEEMPVINPSIYGISKYVGELLLKDISSKIPTIAFRLPGIIGKGSQGPWLSKVLEKTFKGEDLTIYNPSNSFNNVVYLPDLSIFILHLLEKELKGFDAINLACNGSLTVEEVVKEIIRETGSISKVIIKKSDKVSFTISINKAKQVYSYQPESIKNILKKFVIENKVS